MCEILTAADAMPLPVAGSSANSKLFRARSERPVPPVRRRPCPEPTATAQLPCHPHASRSGPKTMPSGHAPTLSKEIHTSVIYQPPANCAPIASLPGYRSPTVCILLKETAQDRAVQVGTGGGKEEGSKISRICWVDSDRPALDSRRRKKYGTVSAGLMRQYDTDTVKNLGSNFQV